MANTRDWEIGSTFQGIVYGPSKTGKTFGAYTFPRPIVMDFDKGIATASNPTFISKFGYREIEYEQFFEKKTRQGLAIDHNAFDDACKYFDRWMASGARDQFDTWIIDSGTTLSESAMNKAYVLLGGKSGFKGVRSDTLNDANNFGILVPRIQDYGAERSLVEQFVTQVKSSGKNVVFICHQKEKTDDSGNIIAREPMLTGKGAEAISLMFDEVYFLKVRGENRLLQTQADAITKAGSRYGIPNDTPWNWDAINTELKKLRELKAAAKAAVSQPVAR